MKLYLRGNVWYVTHWTNGKQIKMSTGCTDRTEAERKAVALLAPVVTQTDDEVRVATAAAICDKLARERRRTIAEQIRLADCWGKHPHNKNSFGQPLKESTVRTARVAWLAFVRYAEARKVTMAAGVTARFAVEFLETRAPRSRVVTCRLCKAMLARVGIEPNPFDIKTRNPPTTHREPLTREQVTALLAEADRLAGHPQGGKNKAAEFAVFVRFLLYTGLRLGDAATARVDQVDWREATLTRTMAKTGKAVRFPLHPDLFKRLDNSDIYLFPAMARQYGKRPDGLTLRFRRLFASLGIVGDKQQYCAHCLRTTFASICAENGVPLAVIQSWLGHSSQTVTRIYARIEDMRAKRRALAKFPEL